VRDSRWPIKGNRFQFFGRRTRIIARLIAADTFKKGLRPTMGNKDRRKEKKKPKQPKNSPKTSNQGKLGAARLSK
jgi:hypothetical protein